MSDTERERAESRQYSRISLTLLTCLAIGAVVVALFVTVSNQGVLAEKRAHVRGEEFALWLTEGDDEVWVGAQQNPGWLSKGAYSTSIFVAADSKTAAPYGPEFHVPVIPRSRWNQAEIHIDQKTATARLVLDDAEIMFDFREMSFGDPKETVDTATP